MVGRQDTAEKSIVILRVRFFVVVILQNKVVYLLIIILVSSWYVGWDVIANDAGQTKSRF